MDLVALMNNGADTMGSSDGPDEESNTSTGDKVGLDGKEMSNLVDREPDSWQAPKPEDEEADKFISLGTGALHSVRDIQVAGPD